jgi:HEAT repeat protein
LVAVGFLLYPFLFKKVYLRYLLNCLNNPDLQLVANAIQALGEKNKKKAARPLLELLRQSKEVFLKRTIVLSLGQMQSRMAYKEIISLFSVRNESLQLSVLNALSHYKNYESMFLMLRLMRSKKGVTFRVRSNAGRILTKLMGKKMVPFLMESLHSKDDREVANGVESIGIFHDKKTISMLLPFLLHPNHRVKANAIIALYPFRSARMKVLQALDELYHSIDISSRLAAIYAIGSLRLKKYIPDLVKMLPSKGQNTQLQVMTALAKMDVPSYCGPYVQFLLNPGNPLRVEAAKRFAEFPRFSRWLLFEEIAKLPADTRRKIYFLFAETPIDLSEEKALMASQEMVPDLSHL